MTVPSDRDEGRLSAAGAAWRDALAEDVAAFDAEAGRARALSARASTPPRQARGKVFAAVAFAATVALGIGVGAVSRERGKAAPLAYTVQGVSDQGGYLLVPATATSAPASVRFSDGSMIRIEPDTRARIAEVSPFGARFQIEEGRARFQVTHRPGTHWNVVAGPYTIAITGTAFDVDWRAAEPSLVVRLHEGSVRVQGPSAPLGVTLSAGQRLVARPDQAMLLVEPDAPAGALASASAAASGDLSPQPLLPSAATAADVPALAPSASAGQPAEPTWSQRIARSDFDGVLRDAEARGVDGVLASGSLGDVSALADAARLRGKTSLAKRALLSERQRFPGSPAARRAAFFLGRLAEDAERAPAAAIGWYDTYLAESASGPYASEALGRKMLAVRATQGPSAARGLAESYVRLYPSGAYANVARALLEPTSP